MGTNADLYHQDFYRWTQETAALIEAGKWHEIDPAVLADEDRPCRQKLLTCTRRKPTLLPC